MWPLGLLLFSENEPSEADQDKEAEDNQEDEVDKGKEPLFYLGLFYLSLWRSEIKVLFINGKDNMFM